MRTGAAELRPSLLERLTSFFVHLGAAARFVFFKRSFLFGFVAGWCAAFSFVLFVLHNKGLLGDGVQNFASS
jgi:hypothetical protein